MRFGFVKMIGYGALVPNMGAKHAFIFKVV